MIIINTITALEQAKHFREQIKPLLRWMFHDTALLIRLTELKPLEYSLNPYATPVYQLGLQDFDKQPFKAAF